MIYSEFKIVEKNTIYDVKIDYDDKYKYYTISCFKENNSNVLGELTFKIAGKYERCVFLYDLKNTSEVGKGVGSALIDALEYFALNNRIEKCEAKFYPTDDRAKRFYESRGYEIYKDGYETMLYKAYYEDRIIENVLPKIVKPKNILKNHNNNTVL